MRTLFIAFLLVVFNLLAPAAELSFPAVLVSFFAVLFCAALDCAEIRAHWKVWR